MNFIKAIIAAAVPSIISVCLYNLGFPFLAGILVAPAILIAIVVFFTLETSN